LNLSISKLCPGIEFLKRMKVEDEDSSPIANVIAGTKFAVKPSPTAQNNDFVSLTPGTPPTSTDENLLEFHVSNSQENLDNSSSVSELSTITPSVSPTKGETCGDNLRFTPIGSNFIWPSSMVKLSPPITR
jgi:hypothetical protein